MPSIELGTELVREDKLMRCVRITQQVSLFQNAQGETETLDEHLLEWKGADGSLDFEALTSNRNPYTGPIGTIKAPEPIVWRKD